MLKTTGDIDAATVAVADALLGGGVAVVPTDTVYGLMCWPGAPDAVDRLFAIKQRPPERRLPIIVASADQARTTLPLRWTREGEALANELWPGALTIAFGTAGPLPDWLVGRDEVAVRAPAHPLIVALAARLGPLLMTSANRHGAPTPRSARDVLSALASAPTIAVDGGKLSDAASTLVNTNLSTPTVEREGVVPATKIAKLLGHGR